MLKVRVRMRVRMCENVSETFLIFGGSGAHSESGKESIWDPPAAAICHSHACDCHCTKYFLLFFLKIWNLTIN